MHRLFRRERARLEAARLIRRIVFGLQAVGSNRHPMTLLRAGRLLGAGRFNSAAAALEGVRTKNEHVWRMLLRSYLGAHRFEDILSSYEAMPDGFKKNFDCRFLWLSAAAHLRRFDIIQQGIEELLEEPDEGTAATLLNRFYPFAGRAAPEVHRAVVDRLVTYRSELVTDHFDSLLKCVHDLRARGWMAESRLLEDVLRANARDPRKHVKLDVLDAQLSFWDKRYDLQVEAINRILAKQDLNPVALIDGRAPLTCDNLKAGAPSTPVHGPLVSILMPAYNSGRTIAYALGSLRNQTYQNFEVIVVDDASHDDTAGIVEQFSAIDPRFRLVSLNRNSGAFVARNTALAEAAGEFVTNQDADDWAHPQKIATAVAELQRDLPTVATWVDHVRCSSTQGFRAIDGYIRPDASSLMFRRKPVMEKVGWYDSVRAAGDGEFHLRLERAFGRHSIRHLSKLLSFVSWSETSLSGAGAFEIDSDLNIYSPDRNAYRRAFGLWHETAERLYMPFPLERQRPFSVPESLLPSRSERST